MEPQAAEAVLRHRQLTTALVTKIEEALKPASRKVFRRKRASKWAKLL
jgi:phage gpG-like protein